MLSGFRSRVRGVGFLFSILSLKGFVVEGLGFFKGVLHSQNTRGANPLKLRVRSFLDVWKPGRVGM